MKTRWSCSHETEIILDNYPRPQLVRSEWMNLNGYWDCLINNQMVRPSEDEYQQKVLVPFSIETSLSGIEMQIDENNVIHYRRNFRVPNNWENFHILLHFEAVDWECSIEVNGENVGMHQGGYLPFTFDINKYLLAGDNELYV